MNKVKVSADEAKAFEKLKELIAKRKGSDEVSHLVLGFAELAAGYENNRTPEEQVHDRYLSLKFSCVAVPKDSQTLNQVKAEMEGIKFTLNTLGVQIKGVNA